jgi:hypothetical protein
MSNAPTGAATLRDPAESTVDGALRAWRAETDRRRSAFQESAARHNADQAARRRRLFQLLAGGASFVGGMAAVAVVAVGALRAPTVVEPTFAAAVPALADGTLQVAERSVEQPVVAGVALAGDVRSWSTGGFLWLQFDYHGAPVTLHWYDAAGTEVLEPTSCTNRTATGAQRCYIGRSPARLAIARDHGAVAGTWSVEACQAGTCQPVATYSVD